MGSQKLIEVDIFKLEKYNGAFLSERLALIVPTGNIPPMSF